LLLSSRLQDSTGASFAEKVWLGHGTDAQLPTHIQYDNYREGDPTAGVE